MEKGLHLNERERSTDLHDFDPRGYLLAAALLAAAFAPGWHPAAALGEPGAGYRRLTREEVTEHTVRRALLTRIHESPGITVGSLATLSELDYKTVSHHAKVLLEFRLVERLADGRLQRLFPAGGLAHPLRPLREATATATAAALLHLVAAEPGAHPALLARRLGIAKSTVKWHVDRLASRGVLQVETTPTGLRIRVDPRYVGALAPSGSGRSAS